MAQERYDIEAAKNILNMLKRTSPGDYERLMAQLRGNVGLAGLGETQAETGQPGFWERLIGAGSNALTTIADYRLQEEVARNQQRQYGEAVEAEMARQAMLAEQARSQALEFQNQLELTRQTQELTRAAETSKQTFNWALAAAAALGVVLVWRLVA